MRDPGPSGLEHILVPGTGPLPSPLLGLGQNPGESEVTYEPPTPFVGPAGQMLDRHLDTVGLHRSEMYLSNVYHYYTHMDREPTAKELESDLPLLMEEIEACQPEVVMTLGACPTRWLSRLCNLAYRDLDTSHGIPQSATLDGHSFILIPVVHPAAALYSPESANPAFYDLQVVKSVLDHGWEPQPAMRGLVKEKITSIEHLHRALSSSVTREFIAIDTEGAKENPWGLTFCMDTVHGYQIYAHEKEILWEFYSWLRGTIVAWGSKVLLHNSMHDLSVLETMGISLPDGSYLDTMILSFLLCLEPQGLKPLSWRHLGMELRDYDDVVGPRAREMAIEYLMQALAIDWDRCEVCGAEGVDAWGKTIAGKWHPHGGWGKVPREWLKKSGGGAKGMGGIKVKFGKDFLERFALCHGTDEMEPVNKRLEKILADATVEKTETVEEEETYAQ